MAQERSQCWRVGDLFIDVGARSVVRDNQAVALPQLSFKFLLALVEAAPNVLTVDEMMDRVWTGIFINAETVTQRAKLLRDALGDDPKEPRYFAVRRGVGYQLLPQPIRLHAAHDDAAPRAVSGGRRSNKREMVASLILGILALGVVVSGYIVNKDRDAGYERTQGRRPAAIRVAVLPFDNLSADPADAFIARSIPEMVLNRLSLISGLTVIARDSAMLSTAAKAPPEDAGAQLGAGYVVKGSVQRHGNVLRVTCFVVDTAKHARLWSERFDWPVDRLYALQDRIADRVAATLETRVGTLGRQKTHSGPTTNADAYLAYLKGKSLLGRFTVAGTEAASEHFERAVNLDPEFAPAMVALFDARMQGADLRKDDLGPIRQRYQPLLEKALRIDPESGEALFAQAMWVEAPREQKAALFRRAAELDPSNSRGLTAFAQFLGGNLNGGLYDGIGDGNVTRDDVSSAARKQLLERVLSIDPLNSRARFVAIMQKLGELTPEQLEREQARALQLDPENLALALRYTRRLWMFHGETADAIERIERVIASDPQNPMGPQSAFAYYLDANDPVSARAVAASTPATRDSSRALLAAYRGDVRAAGEAALARRGFLFNRYENWIWPEIVRDHVLKTRQYNLGAQAIASRFGFDLRNPRTLSLPQSVAAPALGHILITAGRRQEGERLLAQTIQWIDAHPKYGLVGVYRTRAAALMLLGDKEQALSNLKSVIETGRDLRHWWYLIDRDPVWIPVHDDPRFKAIADYCRKAAGIQNAKLAALRGAGKVPVRQLVGQS